MLQESVRGIWKTWKNWPSIAARKVVRVRSNCRLDKRQKQKATSRNSRHSPSVCMPGGKAARVPWGKIFKPRNGSYLRAFLACTVFEKSHGVFLLQVSCTRFSGLMQSQCQTDSFEGSHLCCQRQGPLLQCNVFENLKLVQNKDHGKFQY